MPFVERGAHRLHYDVIDIVAPWRQDSPTILFHHGIGADSGIWTDWIYPLAERYRLVRFDMRGFGRSDLPDADSAWSIDLLSDDVLAVADAAAAASFHFVGESMGGTIGLYCGLKHPGRFSSLTMSNAAHIGGSIHKVETWRRTIEARGMTGWSDEFMADRFHPHALSADRAAWFAHQQAAGNPNSVLNALSVLTGVDLRAELASLRLPVLVMHPDGSPFIPVPVVAELCAGLPDAELHVFGHAKHGLPLSHGRKCAATLHRFLYRRFGRGCA